MNGDGLVSLHRDAMTDFENFRSEYVRGEKPFLEDIGGGGLKNLLKDSRPTI